MKYCCPVVESFFYFWYFNIFYPPDIRRKFHYLMYTENWHFNRFNTFKFPLSELNQEPAIANGPVTSYSDPWIASIAFWIDTKKVSSLGR